MVARIPTRRAAPRRADARVHGIGKIRWRGACCMYACTRTRPRSRACVHFHRRARRNCKVAYMQGVKLAARGGSIRENREISRDPTVATAARNNSLDAGRTTVCISNNIRFVIEFSSPSIRSIIIIIIIIQSRYEIIFDLDSATMHDRIWDYIFIEKLRFVLHPTNIPRDKLNLRRNLRHSHS